MFSLPKCIACFYILFGFKVYFFDVILLGLIVEVCVQKLFVHPLKWHLKYVSTHLTLWRTNTQNIFFLKKILWQKAQTFNNIFFVSAAI